MEEVARPSPDSEGASGPDSDFDPAAFVRDVVLLVDGSRRVVAASPTAGRVFGRDELVGRTLDEILATAVGTPVRERLADGATQPEGATGAGAFDAWAEEHDPSGDPALELESSVRPMWLVGADAAHRLGA